MISLISRELGLPDRYFNGSEQANLDKLWNRFRDHLLGHTVDRQGFNRRTVADVLNQQNKSLDLSWSQRFMLQVRFATKGVAIGSQRFVGEILKDQNGALKYRREHRPEEARAWDKVYCLKKHRLWVS
ncbi:MAG: hypothetical protein GY869_05335 [Planctomycetes bacterium]|nr:hypothetical protein [Planctomycetota bacterium]